MGTKRQEERREPRMTGMWFVNARFFAFSNLVVFDLLCNAVGRIGLCRSAT
jgi:hypothetical protein